MGMSNCCVPLVPADGDFEMLAKAVANWAARHPAGSDRSIQATDQTPGHWKERVLQQSWRLGRTLLEEAAQRKPASIWTSTVPVNTCGSWPTLK
jgi:hypothetical protein